MNRLGRPGGVRPRAGPRRSPGGPLRATASLGVACRRGADGAELVARADAALYRAKESGRDRVEADDPSVPLARSAAAAE